jgi:hypothetical protein
MKSIQVSHHNSVFVLAVAFAPALRLVPAEREVMEACVRQLESPSLPTGVRDLLAPLVTLFAASCVERELSWYLTQEVVTPKVGGRAYLPGACDQLMHPPPPPNCYLFTRLCLQDRRW